MKNLKTVCLLTAISTIVLVLNPAMGTSEVQSLREVLLQPNLADDMPNLGKGPKLDAINRLSKIGTPEAIGVLQEFLTTHGADRHLKRSALAGLGKIGSRGSLKAVEMFEKWARKVQQNPASFRFGRMECPVDHFGPYTLIPLAECKDENGTTWAVFLQLRFGDFNLWLTKSLGNGEWSNPIYLELAGFPKKYTDSKGELKIEDKKFVLALDGKTYNFSVAEQTLDGDKDGLTNAVERCLRTDPNNSDTDGDGLIDGKDANPLTPKQKASDEPAKIRQAVFLVAFATCNSRDAVIVVDKGDFAKQEYYGYGGVLLKSPKIRDGFFNLVELDVKMDSPTTATATVEDWEGERAASGNSVKLKKINGKWVVIEYRHVWIS